MSHASVSCVRHSLPVTCTYYLYASAVSIPLYLSLLIFQSLSVTYICHQYVSPESLTCIHHTLSFTCICRSLSVTRVLHTLSLTFILHLYQAHSVIRSSSAHFELRMFRNKLFLDHCDLTVVRSYLMVNRQCTDVLLPVILLLPDRNFTR